MFCVVHFVSHFEYSFVQLKMTPLHWAVEKGHFPVIEVLIRQGADLSCMNKVCTIL